MCMFNNVFMSMHVFQMNPIFVMFLLHDVLLIEYLVHIYILNILTSPSHDQCENDAV